jgi:flavodoxin
MISKPLIIYYSKTGTTAKIVEIVLPMIKAESRRLGEPKGLMGRFNLGGYYRGDNGVKESNTIINEFDPIILLTPVRKGKPSPAMIEFLEKIDLKGKRVVLGLVGKNETNPKALDKLRRIAMERGCNFIETIYLRGVLPGRDWTDLNDEDYLREAAKLADKVSAVSGFSR